MSTEKSEPAGNVPALQKDAKISPKAAQRFALLVALAQPGKPLHAFWLAPSQETLTSGVAKIAIAMTKAGQSEEQVIGVLNMIQASNASALRQAFEAKITLPAGQKRAVASTPTADLAALGL